MNAAIIPFVQHVIADRVGLDATARIENNADGTVLTITPSDLHPNDGFSVQLKFGWRSVEANVVPGLFSGHLLGRMGECGVEARHIFATIASALIASRKRILMRVNGTEVSAADPMTWPQNWIKFELTLKSTPIVVEDADQAQQERMVLDLAIPVLHMMVALIGVEETDLLTLGEFEGKPSESSSRRYERSRLNREACVQLKGWRCLSCGFDFAETYGPLGMGYIEVHHINPLSTLNGGYRVNVATELVPLCANCHAMAHREEPPVSIDRLKKIVADRRAISGTSM